jgi:Protein of unknown function (DUF3060)
MRTVQLLACVAVLALFSGFSCAANSAQGDRADSKVQSGNANSTADDKKVSTSAGGASVEVKSSGDKGSVEVKGSGDSGSVAVNGSGNDGSVVVKGSGEGNNSVTISAGGIAVSDSANDSEKGGDVVKISGMNQRLSYECKDRSYSVEGTSNTVTLSGQCQSLRVTGTTNQVDVESVATINVSGIRNRVTWERGVNNKRPTISNSGINNTISEKGN